MHLERLLRAAGRELAHRQVARLWKVPEEMTQTPCDFMGFRRDGIAILLEAKQVARKALPVNQSPGLLPHQFGALQEAWKAGAVSLVAWARVGQIALVPFERVLQLSIVRGVRSVPWGELDLIEPEGLLDRLDELITDHRK